MKLIGFFGGVVWVCLFFYFPLVGLEFFVLLFVWGFLIIFTPDFLPYLQRSMVLRRRLIAVPKLTQRLLCWVKKLALKLTEDSIQRYINCLQALITTAKTEKCHRHSSDMRDESS